MNKIVFVLLSLLLLSACAGKKAFTAVPEFVVRERLVPVPMSPDSVWLKLYFECDSNDQVVLSRQEKGHTPGMNVDLLFQNGFLDFLASTKGDTVYIPGKDSLIYIPVPGKDVPVNYVTTWQSFWIVAGQLGALWLVLSNLPAILKWIKNKIKL